MDMNMMNMTRRADLASRAMLVSFGVSQWTAHKRDKVTSAEIADQKGASRSAGNYNKVLIGKDALAKVSAAVSAGRTDHAFYSLPWMNDGTRILPVQVFDTYSAKMRANKEQFDSAVSEFIGNYSEYVEEARKNLGSLFNYDDYPMRQEIRKRFNWSISVMPMPDAADFRVNLDSAVVAAMQTEMTANIQSAMGNATSDAFSRLHGVVKTMAEKLKGYDPTAGRQGGYFRDTLVTNLAELIEIMPGLNLTGDAALAAHIEAARENLITHSAQTLRDDWKLRDAVANEATRIADEISNQMGWFE